MGNPSVQFVSALAVDEALMERLATMPFTATGTRRICLHGSESSLMHAMLVESEFGSSFPGHYHSDSDEVTVAMRGHMEVLVWVQGLENPPTRLILGQGDGEVSATFVPKHTPHVTRPLGGNCVYLEVKLGPFKKDAMLRLDETNLSRAKSGPELGS